MTTTMKTSPFSLLLNRKSEKLSKGAFQPHAAIEEEDRTSYSFAQIDVAAYGDLARVPSPLGLGYLQAVLSVLRIAPHMSYDAQGMVGRMEVRGAEMYSFSWNENGGTECQQGGFVYEGKPNYYSAMLGLIQCVAMYLSGERLQSQEVVTAWCKLLRAMEATFPRTSNIWGWKEEAISDACLYDETRHAILRVCDCLRAAMQYQLAVKHKRQVFVYEHPVIRPDEGIAIEVEGHKLLDPSWIEMTAALATPLPVPHPVSATTAPSSKPSVPLGTPISPTSTSLPPPTTTHPTPTRPLGGSPASSPTGSTSPGTGVSHATPTAPRSSSDLYGPYLDMVRMALAQGGSLLLVGPTGTGKSSLLLDAATSLGWGVELIVCHEGKRIHILQGGHTRDVEKGDGDWRFAAGPITRLARRIEAGERVMLILDELARAHKEVFAYVMDLLNSYSSREIQAMIPKQEGDGMKLELPADFRKDERVRYHILSVDVLQRRFVVDASHILIAATANQGESYGGNDFADPAFCRRWTHWLHLAGYDDTVIRQILADKCSLPPTSPLIGAILQVTKAIHTYHEREDVLKMTLSLPLLINWCQQTIWYCTNAQSKHKGNPGKSFEMAARNSWLARICPYKGAELDPDVERILLSHIATPRLSSLR
jgi:hypothetical protein